MIYSWEILLALKVARNHLRYIPPSLSNWSLNTVLYNLHNVVSYSALFAEVVIHIELSIVYNALRSLSLGYL
ncbi:MAG: hypothetical protein QXU13_04730 [Desulfurococcaceae archaeon]